MPTHPPPRDRQNNHVKKRGALHHIYVQADLLMKERALEKLAEKCSRLDHQRNGRELPVRSIWAEGNQIGRRDDHLVPV